ncbi:unnamed protein product, partial [Phaeothamnion confervicola]
MERLKRIVYLGDGRGDYCPITRLRPGDVALVRRSETKSFGLYERIAA